MRVNRSTDRRWDWWRAKRLGWPEGYRILLRIEARFWERGERTPEVEAILAGCRRAVLVELGYRVK